MPLTQEEREEYLTGLANQLIREMLAVEKPPGEVMLEDIERGYYYCRGCKRGSFPPG